MIAHEKGLTSDEFAFYGLLEPFYNLLFNTNDSKRRQFAKDLVKIIQDEIFVDWTEREVIELARERFKK